MYKQTVTKTYESMTNTRNQNETITAKTVRVSDIEKTVMDIIVGGLPNGEHPIAYIASCLHMSEQTLRRRVVEATGKLPKDFILSIRMNCAANMLMDDKELSLTAIGHACGFDELSSFSRSFKRYFGCSPTLYRENDKKMHLVKVFDKRL